MRQSGGRRGSGARGSVRRERTEKNRVSPVQHRRSGSLRSRKVNATPEALSAPSFPAKQPPSVEQGLEEESGQQEHRVSPGPPHTAGFETPDFGSDPAWWWPAELRQRRDPVSDQLLVWEMRLSKEHGGRPYCAPTPTCAC